MIWHIRASNKDLLDRILYRISSKIILVANALRNRFDWTGNIDKAVTIYNGVDLSEFEQRKAYNQIRQKYGIKNKDILIQQNITKDPQNNSTKIYKPQ